MYRLKLVDNVHTMHLSIVCTYLTLSRVYSSSVRDNKSPKPQSGQAKLNLHPQTPQEWPSDEYRKRLGLDRPGNKLKIQLKI